jgi:hypothetical protein
LAKYLRMNLGKLVASLGKENLDCRPRLGRILMNTVLGCGTKYVASGLL